MGRRGLRPRRDESPSPGCLGSQTRGRRAQSSCLPRPDPGQAHAPSLPRVDTRAGAHRPFGLAFLSPFSRRGWGSRVGAPGLPLPGIFRLLRFSLDLGRGEELGRRGRGHPLLCALSPSSQGRDKAPWSRALRQSSLSLPEREREGRPLLPKRTPYREGKGAFRETKPTDLRGSDHLVAQTNPPVRGSFCSTQGFCPR